MPYWRPAHRSVATPMSLDRPVFSGEVRELQPGPDEALRAALDAAVASQPKGTDVTVWRGLRRRFQSASCFQDRLPPCVASAASAAAFSSG
jgi:hypothetical protein